MGIHCETERDTQAGNKPGNKVTDEVRDKGEYVRDKVGDTKAGDTVGDNWETTGRQGSKVPRTRRLEIETQQLSHGLGKLGTHKF